MKVFIRQNLNVLLWNYRNYGRSQGQPNPYNSKHDAEAILKFLVEKIQVKGQIGCFGRSLGGTVVTHLASHYPEHIKFVFVDRSLGNLRTMSNQNFKGKFS